MCEVLLDELWSWTVHERKGRLSPKIHLSPLPDTSCHDGLDPELWAEDEPSLGISVGYLVTLTRNVQVM